MKLNKNLYINENDLVIIYLTKNDLLPVIVTKDLSLNNKFGHFKHNDIIGKKFGSKVRSILMHFYLL